MDQKRQPISGKEPSENSPHYIKGGIEAISVIEAFELDYNEGNVAKYLLRAKLKGDYLQDLKKARWYLNRAIDRYKESLSGVTE